MEIFWHRSHGKARLLQILEVFLKKQLGCDIKSIMFLLSTKK